jgi:hypothetical protein
MYYNDRFIKNSIILQLLFKCDSECQGCTKLYISPCLTSEKQRQISSKKFASRFRTVELRVQTSVRKQIILGFLDFLPS